MIALTRRCNKLDIKLKYDRVDPTLTSKVVAIRRSLRVKNLCVVTSLDLASLNEVKALAAALTTGLIVTHALRDPVRVAIDYLASNCRCRRCLCRNCAACWSIRTPSPVQETLHEQS